MHCPKLSSLSRKRCALTRRVRCVLIARQVHYVLSAETDAIWASTAGAGYGYSRHGADHRLFMVTISHELHCLRMFNLALAGKLDFHHVKHCLDYLRHGVLCSADLTLEPGDFADRNFTRVRVGETHMCLDWSMVYDVLQTNWENWSSTKEAQS